MQFHIVHETKYIYGQMIRFCPHFIYLHPREDQLLDLARYHLSFSPEAQIQWMRDDCDNVLGCARIMGESDSLLIRSEFMVKTADVQPLAVEVRDYAKTYPFQYEPLHAFNLASYLVKPSEEIQAALRQWLDCNFKNRPTETLSFLYALNESLYKTLQPHRRNEEGIQPSMVTAACNAGACRDYAVFLIEILRTLGFAARFVSGYYYDPAVSGTPTAAMHAWAEVYVPGAGWKGLDPTAGVFCFDAYVPVAHAAVAASVNPIQGSFIQRGGIQPSMSIRVLMEKIDDVAIDWYAAPAPNLLSA
jgi:hypothetical protein